MSTKGELVTTAGLFRSALMLSRVKRRGDQVSAAPNRASGLAANSASELLVISQCRIELINNFGPVRIEQNFLTQHRGLG